MTGKKTNKLKSYLVEVYSPVRPFMEKVHLHAVAESSFSTVIDKINKLEYKLSKNEMEIENGDWSGSFDIDNKYEFTRISRQGREKEIINRLLNELESGDVLWDVGANVGLYSILCGAKLENGKVIAFDPHPENADKLNKNASLNDIRDFTVKSLALGNKNETMKLQLEDSKSGAGGGTLVPDRRKSDDLSTENIEVKVRSGDELVKKGLEEPNFIKIDVEGAELEVLEGLEKTLNRGKCRGICCEVHCHYGVSQKGVEDLLRKYGFKTKFTQRNNNQIFILAVTE
jgi:FkbM family methyltransferase